MERIITVKGSIENMSKAESMVSSKLRQSYENDLQAMAVSILKNIKIFEDLIVNGRCYLSDRVSFATHCRFYPKFLHELWVWFHTLLVVY